VVENGLGTPNLWRLDTVPLVAIGGPGAPRIELFRVAATVRLPDRRIIVADGSPRLMLFSEAGQHLHTTGTRGAGPGEFEAIGWIEPFASDSIIVYDPRLSRASVFADSLRFVRTLTPGRSASGGIAELLGMFRDRSFLSTSRLMAPTPSPSGGLIRPHQVLSRHDPDGRPGDSLTTVPGDEFALAQRVIIRPPFAKRTRIAVGSDEIFVATADRFEVSAYDRTGRLRRIFRRGSDAMPVTDTDLAEYRLSQEAGLTASLTYPAVGALLVDDVGNVWVEEFRKETDAAANWAVFDASGRLLGMVTFMERFRPLHIGGDFVLGVWLDDLGVEEVRLYRLEKRG
jgi:hypothetical protein